MSALSIIGVGLSALALLVTLAIAADAMRRRDLRLAGRPLRGAVSTASRVGLVGLTLAAFAAGVFGTPLLATSRPLAGDDGAAGGVAMASERTVRLPFYVHTIVERYGVDGALLGGATRRVLQIPWLFLGWTAMYWLVVVRRSPRRVLPERRA
ncbi:MAG: hypothetical protein ACRELC_07515 [Gemmatimonadota bacterium]